MPPIDLLVWERSQLYRESSKEENGQDKDKMRKTLLRRWQTRWEMYEGHARTFVRDVAKWCERKHGGLNYYVMHAMSGYGVFGTYLKGIGKARTDTCWYCGTRDTPAQTVFECGNFDSYRRTAESECGIDITENNVADLLLKDEKSWNAVTRMFESIMWEKCAYERTLRDPPSLSLPSPRREQEKPEGHTRRKIVFPHSKECPRGGAGWELNERSRGVF
ncbi:uncharacterized protein [Euwallacea fornicatus]|uniref:uncharacterized protein n=1 Tax=Euwallacea fornicatus TaxID=995702 RepID=UPI00338F537B